MKEKLEYLGKFIPITYPLIIFIGFYNYLSYYKFFDIEIFPYLTIYEILFSIVSELTPILITILIVLFYLTFLIILPFTKKQKNNKLKSKSYSDPKFERLQRIKERDGISTSFLYNNLNDLALYRWENMIKKFKRKEFSRAFYHFYLLFFNIIGVLIKFSLWLFFFSFTSIGLTLIFSPLQDNLDYYWPFFNSETYTLFSIILWSFIIYAMIYRTSKKNSASAKRFMQILPLIFLTFLSITIYQKRKAERTLKHLTYDIEFQYNGEFIQSSAKEIFVGKTAEYIFLRNIEEKRNFIFPISDIKNLQIQKIQL